MVHRNRHMDQWNDTEDPDVKPHICGYLTSKMGKIHIGEKTKTASSTDGAGKTGNPPADK